MIKKSPALGLILAIFILFFWQSALSQELLIKKLKPGSRVPDNLLSERSVVLYAPQYSYEKLEKIQQTFQQVGIDAVGYFKFDMVFANSDATQAASLYLQKREVSFLILLHQKDSLFSVLFTRFNNNLDMVDAQQSALQVVGPNLDKVLKVIYHTVSHNQPKKNLLINDFPEIDFVLNVVRGKALNFFAVDLKADRLAVPWFGEAVMDSTLVQFFRKNYPFKFDMVYKDESALTLRNKEFLYEIKYVYASDATAKTLLRYPSKETRTTSAPLIVKEISDISMYKFYIQHLVSGDVFLGTEWDAHTGWEESLKAHVDRFKKELGL